MKSVAEAIRASPYVQSHTTLPELNALMIESRGSQAPYDGVTEVWWETMAALERGMSSPAGIEAQAQLMEDEARFIDFRHSRMFMTEEHQIFLPTDWHQSEQGQDAWEHSGRTYPQKHHGRGLARHPNRPLDGI